MSLLCQRFVQKEFRIFMKIESHVYRNEICLTALFIPSRANAFELLQLKMLKKKIVSDPQCLILVGKRFKKKPPRSPQHLSVAS